LGFYYYKFGVDIILVGGKYDKSNTMDDDAFEFLNGKRAASVPHY